MASGLQVYLAGFRRWTRGRDAALRRPRPRLAGGSLWMHQAPLHYPCGFGARKRSAAERGGLAQRTSPTQGSGTYCRSWKKIIGAVGLRAGSTRTELVMVIVLRLAQTFPGKRLKRDWMV